MRRSVTLVSVFLAAFALMRADALGWGSAVHIYVGHQLSVKSGQKDIDQMYGSVAPDIFNFEFAQPALTFAEITHTDWMAVRQATRGQLQNALAYGFTAHNLADYTAHNSGQTFGQGVGYVIEKAEMLGLYYPLPDALGLPEDVKAILYHTFIEVGVDILMKRMDPEIAARMFAAASGRSDVFPGLLGKAYAKTFAGIMGVDETTAGLVIAGYENWFRTEYCYGYALSLDGTEVEAIGKMAVLLAGLAEGFLGSVPPGVDLEAVIAQYLMASMYLCQDDFAAEIQATLLYCDSR